MNDLNTLMHAAVDTARPDLDRLLAGAVQDGRRIRRRRTIAYAGAGLAAGVVAGATFGAATLFASTHATELQPAAGRSLDVSAPHATPSAIALDLDSVHTPGLVRVPPAVGSVPPSASPDDLKPLKTSPRAGASVAVPFAVKLHGWTCGAGMDDKVLCTGPHGRSAQITWRPASQYQRWITDPDKEDAAASVTTKPHGRYFATVTGDSATLLHDLATLAGAIVWK